MTTEEPPSEIGVLLASLAEAALASRPAVPLQPAPIDNEAAAFERAVDDVRTTLEVLDEGQWTRPAVNGLTVGELVGHLIGTQRLMAGELEIGGRRSASIDHIDSTRPEIVDGAGMSPREAAEQFGVASKLLTDHLTTLDNTRLDRESRFGAIVADVRFLLVVRIFELWTHDNDLRAAVGLPRSEPDGDRVWMMTRTVMPVVRRISGDRLRIVLTGPGGGVWPAEGEEAGEIVADAIEFCRRIANRLPTASLEAEITGDAQLAGALLDALAGLALD